MKVLFQNRPKSIWQGGDYIQMESIAGALRRKGIEVEINEQPIYTPAIKYRSFDIIHGWNFSMTWTAYQLGLAFMYHKPTVCSMIYHNRDDFVTWREQQQMAEKVDEMVFLNDGEIARCKDKLLLDDEKISIIPNGIDEFWFKKIRRDKESRPYVLTVGRIETHKGQLIVARACKELGLKYLIVGEAKDQVYLDLCLAEGAIYEEPKGREELRRLYADCACFVLNSKAEIQPLTIMEAGAQAKPIIVANGCLWKVPGAYWVECDNLTEIKFAIQNAMIQGDNKGLREWLKEYTWDKIADEYLKIYEKALKKHEGQPAFIWKT